MSEEMSVQYTAVVDLNYFTSPTVTSADPVFHPTSENWFDSQYSGKLYLENISLCGIHFQLSVQCRTKSSSYVPQVWARDPCLTTLHRR